MTEEGRRHRFNDRNRAWESRASRRGTGPEVRAEADDLNRRQSTHTHEIEAERDQRSSRYGPNIQAHATVRCPKSTQIYHRATGDSNGRANRGLVQEARGEILRSSPSVVKGRRRRCIRVMGEQLISGQYTAEVATMEGNSDSHVEELGPFNYRIVEAQEVEPVHCLERIASHAVSTCITDNSHEKRTNRSRNPERG